MANFRVRLPGSGNGPMLAFKRFVTIWVSEFANERILLAFLEAAAGQVNVFSFREAGLRGGIPSSRYIGPLWDRLIGNEPGTVDVTVGRGIRLLHEVGLGDHWRRRRRGQGLL